jgi:hypothetical protein
MPAPAGRTFRELYAARRGETDDERPAPACDAAPLSRRAECSHRERCVLAESNTLLRGGASVVVLHRLPTYAPGSTGRRDRGDPPGGAWTTPRRHPAELRAAAAWASTRVRLRCRGRCGRAARAGIAYTIASTTDHGSGDEVNPRCRV